MTEPISFKRLEEIRTAIAPGFKGRSHLDPEHDVTDNWILAAWDLLDEVDRLTRNQERAARDLDMWLDLHETEAGSARVASAREQLEGPSR